MRWWMACSASAWRAAKPASPTTDTGPTPLWSERIGIRPRHLVVLVAVLLYPFVASPFFTYQIGAQSLALGLIALSLTFGLLMAAVADVDGDRVAGRQLVRRVGARQALQHGDLVAGAEIEAAVRQQAPEGLAALLDAVDRELAVVLQAVQPMRGTPPCPCPR